MRPVFGLILLLAGVAAGGSALAQTQGSLAPAVCGGPTLLVSESIALRRAQQHFARARTLTILTLGSGSTAGTGASSREAAWPARLGVALAANFPQAQIAVVNRAQPRQTARTVYQKLQEDVASVRPQLVIWETGTADAVQQFDVDRFARTLVRGIDHLDEANIDAILLDPQYERIATRLINFEPYLEAIQRVATMRDVGVFQRHALMREWADAQVFDFESAARQERTRLADLAYDCIGRLLADAIARAIR